MKLFKKVSIALFAFTVVIGLGLHILDADTIYSGKIKNANIDDNKITIKTKSGYVTLNVDEKTSVTILDIDGFITVADIGSLLTIDKDGLRNADSVDIVSDSKMFAKEIHAATKRRLMLKIDEIKKYLAEINLGNKLVAEKTKLSVENPGTIKGTVTVKTRSSKDTIVYIETVANNKFTPIPKKYVTQTDEIVTEKEKGEEPEYPLMVQIIMRFKPHILPVLKGSIIDVPNMDTVRHNAFSPEPIPGKKEKITLGTYDVGVTKTFKIDNPGELVLLCNIHKEMSGYVVVLENPYFALTDENGGFTIENVPPGKYRLNTWHKLFKPVTAEIVVTPGKTTEIELPDIRKKR